MSTASSRLTAASAVGLGGGGALKTDRLKEHLTGRDLEAAQRESKDEVVARKSVETHTIILTRSATPSVGWSNALRRSRVSSATLGSPTPIVPA
jgi:hypothetical protein